MPGYYKKDDSLITVITGYYRKSVALCEADSKQWSAGKAQRQETAQSWYPIIVQQGKYSHISSYHI